MRLWHYKLLPYLPKAQFQGQLRELVAILHDWRVKGETNHLLINRVMDYPKSELTEYFLEYEECYRERYGKRLDKHYEEFKAFASSEHYKAGHHIYAGWHNREYLRVCMANLYEKYKFGSGSSKLSEEEWNTLTDGYLLLTGEEYSI